MFVFVLYMSVRLCVCVCVICQEGDKEIATKMQDLALSEGALPRHLHTSMFTISADQRMLTNRSRSLTVHYRRLQPSYTGNHSFCVMQTVESTSRGIVDCRKPHCLEPPEEDTGEPHMLSVHLLIVSFKSTTESSSVVSHCVLAHRSVGVSGQL